MSSLEGDGNGLLEAYRRAKEVKEKHEDDLLAKANVLGVGIGLRERGGEPTTEVVLIVMVTHKVPRAQLAPEDLVPKELEGVGLEVQAVGDVSAHGS